MAEWWVDQPQLSFSTDGDEFFADIIQDIMREDFTYDATFLIFAAQPGSKSLFDHQLESSWTSKITSGCFRYKLNDLRTRYLDGDYKFVIQLNPERAIRRRPQEVTDIFMPFDPNKFHFGQIPDCEKMFDVKSLDWGISRPDNRQEKYKHAVIINVSPIEYCHSLLVPNIDLCYPQVLNFDALRAAVEVMLASADSYLRMGFNSLGAFASVNHLHFHLYHLKCNLFLETAAVEQLYGPCFFLSTYPAEGFAFEVFSPQEICNTVRAVMILVEFLIMRKIPHNIFITRGTPFVSNPDNQGFIYKSLRIYVWARKPYYGTKIDHTGFNFAVCELSGHIPIKDELTYETITEAMVIQGMRETCHDIFAGIFEDVASLYTNRFNV